MTFFAHSLYPIRGTCNIFVGQWAIFIVGLSNDRLLLQLSCTANHASIFIIWYSCSSASRLKLALIHILFYSLQLSRGLSFVRRSLEFSGPSTHWWKEKWSKKRKDRNNRFADLLTYHGSSVLYVRQECFACTFHYACSVRMPILPIFHMRFLFELWN